MKTIGLKSIIDMTTNMTNKLFSAACERNADPILLAITPFLNNSKTVFEIGSGTGQHAVYFGARLPHITWQCSDRIQNHPSISAWQEEAKLSNVLAPLCLDIGHSAWPENKFDAVYTSNTCHILSWQEVQIMFEGVASILVERGHFFIYGPFNYDGQFTSASNAQFDASLKSQALHMGIRAIEDIVALANQHQLQLQEDFAMPANNRLLVLQKINLKR